MRRDAGKEVVDPEEQGDQQQQRVGGRGAAQRLGEILGHPLDEADFVQSRCEFQNYQTNWLTRAQGLVQDGHYLVEQRSRANAGWLFQFNGTGGIWRRATIENAGGWSDYSLTEDLDLTVRAALKDWRGLFVSYPAIPGQVPEGIRDFRRQQRRWSNGFVQVAQRTIAPI